MGKKYVKRNKNFVTLDDYIVGKTGRHIKELNRYREIYSLREIEHIAERILDAVKSGRKILVYGDYDCDGITSVNQFVLLLQAVKANFTVKVPKRFTDGYGIKPEYTTTLTPGSLLILVDNGIAALGAVEIAKTKGIEVLIMDHHMAGQDANDNIVYPKADILLDPEAIPDGNDYCEYCGAGLTYKLAQYMLPGDHPLLDLCAALAAIGTIADVVPLTEDNRQIVQRGLNVLNFGNIPAGTRLLLNELGYSGRLTSEAVAFYLAPVLNAAGRLYDEGATWAARTLLETDDAKATDMVKSLVMINNSRKEIVNALMEQIYIDPNDKINVIRVPDKSPLGCLGLVAGKITEATKRTTFIYTASGDILKGSARSDDETQNHVKEMLDSVKEYMAAYGGHPGAAGFSFPEKNEKIIREKLLAYPVKLHDMTPYYDLDVKPLEVMDCLEQLDQCEPFGKSMERPVFAMNCQFNSTTGSYWRTIGKNRDHISFNIPGTPYNAVGFGLKERYAKDGYPRNIRMIGSLTWNYFKGEKKPQFLMDDYEIV